MQQTQSRINLYALLSRIMLQELDVEMLKMIKNDETILEFFPTFKKWAPLTEM
ncbi:MAG TPA: dehydrogenase, partial [Sulfurimonas sp.]|nr:dehydrogenase [Sulfurimonas sp.]